MPAQERTCPICGEEFVGDTYYCSDQCHTDARQEEDDLATAWEQILEPSPCKKY
jgi:predicted nucleic acid-binding Zn ribbon protein